MYLQRNNGGSQMGGLWIISDNFSMSYLVDIYSVVVLVG